MKYNNFEIKRYRRSRIDTFNHHRALGMVRTFTERWSFEKCEKSLGAIAGTETWKRSGTPKLSVKDKGISAVI